MLGVSLEQTKLNGGLFWSSVHITDGERASVSVLVLHVQEIKELLSRWKGLLHCFQTARGEGGEKTKTQAEKQ